MNDRAVLLFLAAALAGAWLQRALYPSPRTIVIPETEPVNAKLLRVWKGNGP